MKDIPLLDLRDTYSPAVAFMVKDRTELFWADQKLPSFDDPSRIAFTEARIELDKIADCVARQCRFVYETYCIEPTQILLGRDYLRAFVRDESYLRCFPATSVAMKVPLRFGNLRSPMKNAVRQEVKTIKDYGFEELRFSVLGLQMTLHCIPWMVGMVVLPDCHQVEPRPPRMSHDVGNGLIVNEWALHGRRGHQAVGAEQIVAADNSDAWKYTVRVLAGLRAAFKQWAEMPSEKSFLLRPAWWRDDPFKNK